MSVRKILSLKLTSIQTQIDVLSAKEARLAQERARLQGQGDGLGVGQVDAGFQFAAMAADSARAATLRLDRDRQDLQAQRMTLARQKLSLDIADKKLEAEERKLARLYESRAADRV